MVAEALALAGSARGVMVGDTVGDMLAARANGIDAVGVAWGYGEPSSLRAAGASEVAESPAALAGLLGVAPG